MTANNQEHLAHGRDALSFPMAPGFYNMDCMEAMKAFPDKFFDLAIVDPPYGGGFVDQGGNTPPEKISGGGAADWQRRKNGRWGQRFDRYHIGNSEVQHISEKPVEEVRPARGRLRCRRYIALGYCTRT